MPAFPPALDPSFAPTLRREDMASEVHAALREMFDAWEFMISRACLQLEGRPVDVDAVRPVVVATQERVQGWLDAIAGRVAQDAALTEGTA